MIHLYCSKRTVVAPREQKERQPMKKISGFKCWDCGHKFIYPIERQENLGFRENPYWETEYLCPKCKSGDIEDVELEETPEIKEQRQREAEMREDEARYEYYLMSQCRW